MSASKPVFETPAAAESAFYFALERGSLEAMMNVWEHSGDAVCIHPLGPQLRGIEQIRRSWRQLFAGGELLRFRIEPLQRAIDGGLAMHVVVEHIVLLGAAADQKPPQQVLATNVYRRGELGWRLLLHHASPGGASNADAGAAMDHPPPAALH